ncbi:NUDIX domain-containing protein [Neorhizobium sp. DT-125]|uniref:NUDIX domain-containing protein n=1 Tax=Neorhizobium sp. DT-125 TaxID=3396163 RepID=UPI003F1B4EAF
MSYIHRLRLLIGAELLLYPSVAAVIRDADGRLLLQEKRSGEGWSLPAGGIEPGETPQDAVLREVLEETGFEARVSAILGVFGGKDFRYTYPSGDRVEYVVTLFLCETTGRSSAPLDSETKSIRYFAEDEMPPLALPYPKDVLFGRTK